MADSDILKLCYGDGTHGDVVHVEKKSDGSFRMSNLAEVLVVVHFSTNENYEFGLEAASQRGEEQAAKGGPFGDGIDAVAQEWWEWQRRHLYYRINRPGGVVDTGEGILRRVFDDRLCHWTEPGKELPSNRRYPELSIWSDKPGLATQDQLDVHYDDKEGCFYDDENILLSELKVDETERTESFGDSGVNYFELLTEGARVAAEAAGCDPDDKHSLWEHYGWESGMCYGQEQVNGVSGFGMVFKDGSYLAQSSSMHNEIYGNAVFQNVMGRHVEELMVDDTERANLLRRLVDPTLETRLQGLEQLAVLG